MTWSKVLKWDICAGLTTQCYSAQVGSIILRRQHHQLWTHLFFIDGSGNFWAPNCYMKHNAIRILRSCLTHITRWINHFQSTGLLTLHSHGEQHNQQVIRSFFFLQSWATRETQPNFLGSTAANIKSDFSSSFVHYWLISWTSAYNGSNWFQPFKASHISTTLIWKITGTDIVNIDA